MNKALLLITILSTQVANAQGPNYHPMNGTFFIWGEHLTGSNEKDLDGISFFLKGEAARRIYNKMQTEAVYNECQDNGTITKHQGMFECSLSKQGNYSCNFGVSTKEGKIYGAQSC